MNKYYMRGLLVFFLALSAYAGTLANPDAADPYQRIGATRNMSETELRRSFLIALNKFNPALNSSATEEQFLKIKEAGEMLFGPPRSPSGPVDSSAVEGVESLTEARFKKSLKQAAKLYDQLKPYIPQKTGFSEADVAWHVRNLHNESEVVRQNFMFLLGRMRSPTFADILETFERVKNYNHGQGALIMRVSPEMRARVFDQFVDEAVQQVTQTPTVEETVKVASYVSAPMGRVHVYMRALSRARGERQVADLLTAALSGDGIETVSVSTKRALVSQALNSSIKVKSTTSSEYLKAYLHRYVLSRPETSYDRARVLRALEPVLAFELDREILQLVSDIARAEWLSFDITGTATKMLKMWARLEVAHPGLREDLNKAAKAELAPLKAPMSVCATLLKNRALDWFYKKQ